MDDKFKSSFITTKTPSWWKFALAGIIPSLLGYFYPSNAFLETLGFLGYWCSFSFNGQVFQVVRLGIDYLCERSQITTQNVN